MDLLSTESSQTYLETLNAQHVGRSHKFRNPSLIRYGTKDQIFKHNLNFLPKNEGRHEYTFKTLLSDTKLSICNTLGKSLFMLLKMTQLGS